MAALWLKRHGKRTRGSLFPLVRAAIVAFD
jgi:hypothetical protein